MTPTFDPARKVASMSATVAATNISEVIPSLLGLAREMRDIIYEEAMRHETPRPEKPGLKQYDCVENQGFGFMVYQYQPRNKLSLLRCNHQIANEINDLFERKNNTENKLTCKLDLMIWGCSLEPTWLSFPAPAKHIKVLEVDFRIFEHSIHQWLYRPTGVLPPYLLQMLRRLFDNGPNIIPSHTKRSAGQGRFNLPLDNLIINFVQMEDFMFQGPKGANYATGPLFNRPRREIIDLTIESDAPMSKPGNHPSRPVMQGFCWPTRSNGEQNALWNLRDYLEKLAGSGLLFGKVKILSLKCGCHKKEWDIIDMGDVTKAAQCWAPYGWGPVLDLTQMQVNDGSLEYSEELDCLPRDPNIRLPPDHRPGAIWNATA